MRPNNVTGSMAGRKKQMGMSKWGWLFFLGAMALLLTSSLRLGPHYIDFEMVQGVMERLPENKVHQGMSRGEITDHFKKQFRVENFSVPIKEMLNIERTREETTVSIDYEVREHLFYNVDVVLVFSEQRTYR